MTVRIAPLVPIVTATSPLPIAFTPIFESTPSLAPMTNGVCGSMPIFFAISGLQLLKISVVGTSSDNCSRVTPAIANASSSQSSSIQIHHAHC